MRDDFDGRDDDGVYDEDEDLYGDDIVPGLPWPPAGPGAQPPPPDAPPRRWRPRHGVLLVVTAVIAAAAGFLVVLAVR